MPRGQTMWQQPSEEAMLLSLSVSLGLWLD
jgi:hypothetical protein